MWKKRAKIIIILICISLVSSCSKNTKKFEAGDIQEDFCGNFINYQYCQCAYSNQFCEQVAMNSREAKKYVESQYDEWLEREKMVFKNLCVQGGAIFKKDTCIYCDIGKRAEAGQCADIPKEELEELPSGSCRNDTDCFSECEGDVMWKYTCNEEMRACERSYDTDCKTNMETFGDLSFSMICENDQCSRDEDAISVMRQQIEKEISELKQSGDKNKKTDALIASSSSICEGGVLDNDSVSVYLKELREVVVEGESLNIINNQKYYSFLKEPLDVSNIDMDLLEEMSCEVNKELQNTILPGAGEDTSQKINELEAKLERLPMIYLE